MKKIGIIGTGTWGVALANLLSKNGHDVTCWSAIPSEIDCLNQTHTHPNLKGVHISEQISFTKELNEAVEGKELLVMAVPSVFVRSTSAKVASLIKPNQIIVDVAKGIENGTLFTMSEIILEEMNKVLEFDYGQIVALSGPTHAEEVSIGLPSTIVSACINQDNAKIVQDVFSTPYMRVYTNNDIKGVEVSGALKNIIALAAGTCHGLGFGDNSIAALITRGVHEISKLGIAMGCPIHTFYGLAGLGDLIVTCTSKHSRNNQCGIYIGQGFSIEESIKKVGMVVEGMNALDAAHALSVKYHVEMPIINVIYEVVKKGMEPKKAVASLYERESKAEVPFSQLEMMHDSLQTKRVLAIGDFNEISYDKLEFLKQAKSMGDYLIVAIENDEKFREKKTILESLKYVDYVTLNTQEEELINKFNINIVVKNR